MNIITIIDNANEEYAKNGRSKAFEAMENEVITSNKMNLVYLFARYVEGADIDKLQSTVLTSGDMETAFYFAKYVDGSDINKFIGNAIEHDSKIWLHRFVNLATSPFNNRKKNLTKFEDELLDYGIKLESKRKGDIVGLKRDDVDPAIIKAKEEYAQNGRSKQFIKIEKAIQFTTPAQVFLFAKHVPGVDIKSLQKSLILHGDAWNMLLFAQEVKNATPKNLLIGMELAQRDYFQIKSTETDKLARIQKYQKLLKKAIASNKSEREISKISEELRLAQTEEAYSTRVRDYKRRLENLVLAKFEK